MDPKTQILEKIQEKIKELYIGLLSDEEWKKLIQAEVDKFFRINDSYNSNSNQNSQFTAIVREALRIDAQQKMADYLNSPEYQSTWDLKGRTVISQAVRSLLLDNATKMLMNIFEGPMQLSVDNLKNQVNNALMTNKKCL